MAEITRTSTRFVFEDPTRSISPISSTRRSLACRVHRHVCDFVQEQRSFIGQLEPADPIHLRVGEGTLDVAEQFAFENSFGEAAGIHRQHRLGAPARNRVKCSSDHFFPGAGLASDQHVCIRRADPRDQLQNRLHRRSFGDHGRAVLARSKLVLGFQPLAASRRASLNSS